MAFAIALAILICAVPLAYRILRCEQFDSGFSLERWFSFRCERSAGASTSGDTQKTPDATDDGAANGAVTSAAEGGNEISVPNVVSTPVSGYVYYEETEGRAKGHDAAFARPGTSSAPPYGKLGQGMILKTVRGSTVRSGPGGGENIVNEIPGGRCVKLLQDPDRPVHDLTSASSAGWLLVQTTPCPR